MWSERLELGEKKYVNRSHEQRHGAKAMRTDKTHVKGASRESQRIFNRL